MEISLLVPESSREHLGFRYVTSSGKLLLDEKSSEVRKLPGTCDTQYSELNQRPAYNSRVRGLALISKLCFSLLLECQKYSSTVSSKCYLWAQLARDTYPLEYLLSSYVCKTSVEFLNLAHNTLDLALIFTLDLTRLSNSKVKRQFDPTHAVWCP